MQVYEGFPSALPMGTDGNWRLHYTVAPIFNNVWKSLLKRVPWTEALLCWQCCVFATAAYWSGIYLGMLIDTAVLRVWLWKSTRVPCFQLLAQLFSELFNKAFSVPMFVFVQEYSLRGTEVQEMEINMIKEIQLLLFH